jgi:hypothetical protein
MLMRQGDVYIEAIHAIPAEFRSRSLPHGVLVHGEVTGHSHRVENMVGNKLFIGAGPGEMYLEITAPKARIVHEEHGPIDLKKGCYRVWRQREYSPEAIRHVSD